MVAVSELGPSPKVVLVDRYGDGTVWWVMEDSNQRRAVVCIDGRKGSPTQFRLIEGVRHPKKPGGKVLDLGSVEEGIAVPLLSHWLDLQRPNDVVSEYCLEIITNALIRLGDPPEPVTRLE